MNRLVCVISELKLNPASRIPVLTPSFISPGVCFPPDFSLPSRTRNIFLQQLLNVSKLCFQKTELHDGGDIRKASSWGRCRFNSWSFFTCERSYTEYVFVLCITSRTTVWSWSPADPLISGELWSLPSLQELFCCWSEESQDFTFGKTQRKKYVESLGAAHLSQVFYFKISTFLQLMATRCSCYLTDCCCAVVLFTWSICFIPYPTWKIP